MLNFRKDLTNAREANNGKKQELTAIMRTLIFINLLRAIIHDKRTKEDARFKKAYFTRNRKLSFGDMLCLLLDMQKTALQARLNHFFTATGQKVTMSEQALSKARNQFDHSPFEKMLRSVVTEEYSGRHAVPRWREYHLLGADGTTVQIPDTPQTREHFGVLGKNEGQACAGMSVLYDVLNGWVVDVTFGRCGMNERKELKKHIEYLVKDQPGIAKKALLIMDRGYPSMDVIQAVEDAGMKYLCRCSKSFFTEVNAAPTGDSVVIHEKTGMKLRVIKLKREKGEVKTLITNLFEEESSVFEELYALRWGVETAYETLKSQVCVEAFSGRTVNSIYQDMWASMVLMNMMAVVRDEAQVKVDEERKDKVNKHKYAPNIGHLIITLRDEMIFCRLRKDSELSAEQLERVVTKIAGCVRPVKPHRSTPRKPSRSERKRIPDNCKNRLA